MISLSLFSVLTEQLSIIATIIPIAITILSWVFPFPAIGNPKQGRRNDNEERQSKQHKQNSLLIIRIVVSVICLAVSVVLVYKSYTASEGSLKNTPPPHEAEIKSDLEITPTLTSEVTPTPPYQDTAQTIYQSNNSGASITQTALSNSYQELLDKCLLYDSSLELPLEAEMLDQTVIRYVEGSFPKSGSGGMYLCKSPGKERIDLLKPHTQVTVHAVRGSLSRSTGYAFVETGTGQLGWVAFQSTRGTGIGLAETNDF